MKKFLTVKGIESLGVFTNVEHWRYAVPINAKWGEKHKLVRKHRHEKWLDIRANGGETKMTFSLCKPSKENETPTNIVFVETTCDKLDTYCKNRGIRICIGRLIDSLYTKEEKNSSSFEELFTSTFKERFAKLLNSF